MPDPSVPLLRVVLARGMFFASDDRGPDDWGPDDWGKISSHLSDVTILNERGSTHGNH